MTLKRSSGNSDYLSFETLASTEVLRLFRLYENLKINNLSLMSGYSVLSFACYRTNPLRQGQRGSVRRRVHWVQWPVENPT